MARKFRVEDKRLDAKPTMYITLHKGPYTKPKILNKTGWLTKDAVITEVWRDDNTELPGPQRDEDGGLIRMADLEENKD